MLLHSKGQAHTVCFIDFFRYTSTTSTSPISFSTHPFSCLSSHTVHTALFLILMDIILAHSPTRYLILKLLRSKQPPSTPAAKRLGGQFAARFVGCVFLFMMVRFHFVIVLRSPSHLFPFLTSCIHSHTLTQPTHKK